ncbi:uncharacterized protein LOC108956159 isoform X2 [Eucalyptus grandis]|uniref:uncharacterized protein LOC108956159 isoform X2 n=1 Tax=Eucalyptus grandis TaxID=71139 RepID=UPI00192E9FBF|nr:uncharacterized protein LOC108956159 isoform X2 [Eucalyptus grandis]
MVKVAAMGLNPEKHLGKDISFLYSYLHKLKELYGINFCGEGGEYETSTLDCPLFAVLLGTGGMIFPAWLLLYGEFRRTCLHMQNRCLRGYAAFSSFFQNETDLHALLWKFHLLQRHSPVVLRTGSYEPFNKKWNNAYLVCSLLEGLARYN